MSGRRFIAMAHWRGQCGLPGSLARRSRAGAQREWKWWFARDKWLSSRDSSFSAMRSCNSGGRRVRFISGLAMEGGRSEMPTGVKEWLSCDDGWRCRDLCSTRTEGC